MWNQTEGTTSHSLCRKWSRGCAPWCCGCPTVLSSCSSSSSNCLLFWSGDLEKNRGKGTTLKWKTWVMSSIVFFYMKVHSTVHSGPTNARFMYHVCLISSFVRAASVLCGFSQRGDSGCSGGSHHADLPAMCLLRHKGERKSEKG